MKITPQMLKRLEHSMKGGNTLKNFAREVGVDKGNLSKAHNRGSNETQHLSEKHTSQNR